MVLPLRRLTSLVLLALAALELGACSTNDVGVGGPREADAGPEADATMICVPSQRVRCNNCPAGERGWAQCSKDGTTIGTCSDCAGEDGSAGDSSPTDCPPPSTVTLGSPCTTDPAFECPSDTFIAACDPGYGVVRYACVNDAWVQNETYDPPACDGGPGADGGPAYLCTATGGTVITSPCCLSTNDFATTCLIGPCSCADSKPTQVCDCPSGKCFDPSLGCH
jgi:hypothetical protein